MSITRTETVGHLLLHPLSPHPQAIVLRRELAHPHRHGVCLAPQAPVEVILPRARELVLHSTARAFERGTRLRLQRIRDAPRLLLHHAAPRRKNLYPSPCETLWNAERAQRGARRAHMASSRTPALAGPAQPLPPPCPSSSPPPQCQCHRGFCRRLRTRWCQCAAWQDALHCASRHYTYPAPQPLRRL